MKGFPWWGSVLLAICAYYGLKYWLPDLLGQDENQKAFLALLAPICAMGLLLLAAKQLYDMTGERPEKEPDDT